MTLEEYFRHEIEAGAIDFAVRATVVEDKVEVYIHPLNRGGNTTPTLIVKGNLVVPKEWK